MKDIDLINIRLRNQQISVHDFGTIKDAVSWMGAIQAQDYAMMKWAIGLRTADAHIDDVELALQRGEIIRTHLLRPTWHVVSAADLRWMLDLTAPRLKSGLLPRHRELELSERLISKSQSVITKSLEKSQQLPREYLVAELQRAKIPTDENRTSHILMRAELDGLICSGGSLDGKPTYALLEERVLKYNSLTKDEALAKLARTYFQSHGPATLPDFMWWSGLISSDAKQALELVKTELIFDRNGSQDYWRHGSMQSATKQENILHLLPAYDEYLISYKDRLLVLPAGSQRKAVSVNGLFRPIIVMNGQVSGIWKRTIKNSHVVFEAEWFNSAGQESGELLKISVERYGKFLGKAIRLN